MAPDCLSFCPARQWLTKSPCLLLWLKPQIRGEEMVKLPLPAPRTGPRVREQTWGSNKEPTEDV